MTLSSADGRVKRNCSEGRGDPVLDYLGRYAFRVAISHSRLERIEDGQATFRSRDNRTHALRRVTLSVVEFLHRFLQSDRRVSAMRD